MKPMCERVEERGDEGERQRETGRQINRQTDRGRQRNGDGKGREHEKDCDAESRGRQAERKIDRRDEWRETKRDRDIDTASEPDRERDREASLMSEHRSCVSEKDIRNSRSTFVERDSFKKSLPRVFSRRLQWKGEENGCTSGLWCPSDQLPPSLLLSRWAQDIC